MTQHDRRQKLQTGGPGKLALISSWISKVPAQWHSLAMLAAVAGFVLGSISIGEECLCGFAAALIDLAVGGWLYLGG